MLLIAGGLAATNFGIAPGTAEEAQPVLGMPLEPAATDDSQTVYTPPELVSPSSAPQPAAGSSAAAAPGPRPSPAAVPFEATTAPDRLTAPPQKPSDAELPTGLETVGERQPGDEADAAMAKRLPIETPTPASPPHSVTVRSGSHPEFVRFVFDWPVAAAFSVERQAETSRIRFATPATFAPDASVPKAKLRVLGPTLVEIEVPAEAHLRSFALQDHRVVVDVFVTPSAVPRPIEAAPAPSTIEGNGDEKGDETSSEIPGIWHTNVGGWSIKIDRSPWPVCYITKLANNGYYTRAQFSSSTDTFHFFIGHYSWTFIKEGKFYDVSIQFDKNEAWKGQSFGTRYDDTPAFLFFVQFSEENGELFISEFVNSDVISLRHNNKVIGSSDLGSSRLALRELLKCQKAVLRRQTGAFMREAQRGDES